MSDARRFDLRAMKQELTAAGITGRRRARIVDEFADHLACDPDAELGAPRELAHQFRDELGSALARRAAVGTFLALALAGAAMFTLFVWVGGFAAFNSVALDEPGTMLVAGVMAQVALAAGGLALLRAWRLRARTAIPAAEAALLLRRALVGVAAGAVTVASFSLLTGRVVATPAIVLGSVSGVGLIAAAAGVVASLRVRTRQDGGAGDLRTDLGVDWATPRRVAYGLALLLFLGFAVTGALAGDPIDGAVRGIFDGGAALVGYWVLGGFLGIRAQSTTLTAMSPRS